MNIPRPKLWYLPETNRAYLHYYELGNLLSIPDCSDIIHSMLAKIILHANLDQRVDLIRKILSENNLIPPHPDLLYLEDAEKLGVEQTKKIRQFLSLKPYSAKGRAVALESAHNLTLDAQNSLLKSLEEPPKNAIILLGAESESNLLPTIISRCEIVKVESGKWKVKSKHENKYAEDIQRLINSSIQERFEYIEKLEEKDKFLIALLLYFRNKLSLHPKGANLEFVKILLEAQRWQKANVNIRAILEYLMLNLP